MPVLDTEEAWEPEDWQLKVVGEVFAGFGEVRMITPEDNPKTTTMAGAATAAGASGLAPTSSGRGP